MYKDLGFGSNPNHFGAASDSHYLQNLVEFQGPSRGAIEFLDCHGTLQGATAYVGASKAASPLWQPLWGNPSPAI